MDYLDLIKKEIEKVLQNFSQEKINFTVDIPELEHGAVTSNVCLVASKILKKSPQEIFALFGKNLEKNLENICGKVEFKNPGFINFWLKKEFIRKAGKLEQKNVWENLFNYFFSNKKSLHNTNLYGEKILVEHTSVNLFKPFTIGHLMSNFIGEFVKRIYQEFGAEVVNISYPSDISIGIAKAIFVIKKNGGMQAEIFKKSEKEIVNYLGEAYRNGINIYKEAEENDNQENQEIVREIKNIANNLYGNIESEDLEIFEFTKKINLNYFNNILKKLNSQFDNFIFESEAGKAGKKIVLENVGENKIFQKSEGAIVYIPDESRKDINTTVFINSEGNPTYAAKDLGLMKIKKEKFEFDKSYYIVDNEQIPHFKVVFDASEKIFPDLKNKNEHIVHGRMTFKGQKMSSRLGGVPSGEEVIENILEAVQEKTKERNIPEEVKMEIALAALRISILRSKLGVNIDFDPEKALSFEGDSGPYLCYTAARIHSLLQKGKENNLFPGCQLAHDGPERNLERKIFQFENILETVISEISPQKLVTYLFELAGEFNYFYNNTKIIQESNDKENKFESEHYLYVVQKTLNVLTKGLYILGINAPEKM